MLYAACPVLRRRIWGSLKDDTGELPAGETWWVYDDGSGSTGLTGTDGSRTTVSELVRNGKLPGGSRYPVLLKTLHTADRLSVQVHPGSRGGDLFKEETWIFLRTSPDSWMMCGIDPVGREVFMEAVSSGMAGNLMHRIQVRQGDSWHIPPGTVHALGPGVTVLEVQSNCDVTYRLYDWGRTDDSGKTRQLHLEAASKAIDWDEPATPVLLGRDWGMDTGLLGSRYSILPVAGNASVLLSGGSILFLARGTIRMDGANDAPACLMADAEGGECRIEGRGYIIEP